MATKVLTSLGNGIVRVETTFNDGERKDVPISYERPATLLDFKTWVGGLVNPDKDKDGKPFDPDDYANHYGTLGYAFDRYLYGHDIKVRADEREQSAPETTILRNKDLPDGELDLMSLPVPKLVAAINGIMATAAVGAKVANAWHVAKRKLVTYGRAHEKDGILVVGPNGAPAKK